MEFQRQNDSWFRISVDDREEEILILTTEEFYFIQSKNEIEIYLKVMYFAYLYSIDVCYFDPKFKF